MPNDGKRDFPDVSLFASNSFWSHAILFCMSDAERRRGSMRLLRSHRRVLQQRRRNVVHRSAVRQHPGSHQPESWSRKEILLPTTTHWLIRNSERVRIPTGRISPKCDSSKGNTVGNACMFHDVTLGSIDVPCSGTLNCFVPSGDSFGALSVSDIPLKSRLPGTGGMGLRNRSWHAERDEHRQQLAVTNKPTSIRGQPEMAALFVSQNKIGSVKPLGWLPSVPRAPRPASAGRDH